MSDWTDQFDNCDVCEVCGNLVSSGQMVNRLSLAITLLYTHGLIGSAARDACRIKLAKSHGFATRNHLKDQTHG